MVAPIEVPARIAAVGVWVMAAATVAPIVFAMTGWRMSRCDGIVLLRCDAASIAVMPA